MADNLLILHACLGLSQTALANVISVTRQTMSAILGHVSAATMLNIHTHITDEMRKMATRPNRTEKVVKIQKVKRE